MSFFEILPAVARELLYTFSLDFKFLPVYIIVALLIKSKYDKYMGFQNNIYGKMLKPGRRIIEETILLGLVIGFVLSLFIVGIGITIEAEAVVYLFFIIIVLAIINLRYVRFSYAAGILAIISIVFGTTNINITHLLILAAIISMVESILIFFTAGKDTIPVFIKHEGGITGAFLMHKFWPVPIVFLVLLVQGGTDTASGYMTAGWYTQLNPGTVVAGALALGLDSVIALLGYSDIAITRQPEKKSREAAIRFFCYSGILLLLALLTQFGLVFKILASLFSILAYEAVVLYGHYQEKHGKPIFKPVRRGLKVFDIIPGSHAERMGIRRGDVILSVNGKDIQTEEGLNAVLKEYTIFTWIDVLDLKGNKITYQYRGYTDGRDELGIIVVPREKEITYNVDHFENLIILKNLVARFRGLNKHV